VRLQEERVGIFPDGQLRTLQRRVKAWRSEMARKLIFAATDFATINRVGIDTAALSIMWADVGDAWDCFGGIAVALGKIGGTRT
jgi:hypothetical protein